MKQKTSPLPKGAWIAIGTSTAAIVLIFLMIFCYFYFLAGIPGGQFLEGVSIAGTELSGLTFEEGKKALMENVSSTYGKKPLVISILDEQLVIPAGTIRSQPDWEQLLKNAYAYGRTGLPEKRREESRNAIENGYSPDFIQELSLDTERIHQIISDFSKKFDKILVPAKWSLEGTRPDLLSDDFEVDGENLIITLGSPGRDLDTEKLYEIVINGLKSNLFISEYDCPIQQPKKPNLEEIYNQTAVPAKDAIMDMTTFEVSPHSHGYAFDQKDAQALLEKAKAGETIRIPFKKIPAEITAESLKALLYRDTLSTFTATAGSLKGRNINLKLSCQAINGKILMPGEIFSYNPTLGERTPDKGWHEAAGYVGNKTVNEYGGGICQASSCLYYTAMLADLEIVERVNHGFLSSYMPMGMDATVSWGGPEFRFRNNTEYPIRIDASASGGSVTVSLIGTDTKDYYVKMEYEILNKEDWEEKIVELPPDNEEGYKNGQIISTPYTGYTIATYRCKYSKENDALISRKHEVTSYYSKRNKEICKIVYPPKPTEAPTAPHETIPETTIPPTVPETTVPETTVPETTVPPTTVPETSVPPTDAPEPSVPETSSQPIPSAASEEAAESVSSQAGKSDE